MTPKAPPNLGPDGRALWRSTLEGFELTPAELHLLTLAAGALDDAARARADLAAAGSVVVDDRYGGKKAHPSIAIARQAEASAGRLLGQLGLIGRDEDAVAVRHASTPGPKPTRRTTR
jgi:phage terminase small subunit